MDEAGNRCGSTTATVEVLMDSFCRTLTSPVPLNTCRRGPLRCFAPSKALRNNSCCPTSLCVAVLVRGQRVRGKSAPAPTRCLRAHAGEFVVLGHACLLVSETAIYNIPMFQCDTLVGVAWLEEGVIQSSFGRSTVWFSWFSCGTGLTELACANRRSGHSFVCCS